MERVARVYSGDSALEQLVLAVLKNLSLDKPVHLVMDAPYGYVLWGKKAWPRPFLISTGNPCPHYLRDLLELNPDGLIATPVGPDELKETLFRVSGGLKIRYLPDLGADSLYPREREIMRLIATGKTNAELENRFGLQAKTVKNYVTNILDKLGLQNRVEIALYYFGLHPMFYLPMGAARR